MELVFMKRQHAGFHGLCIQYAILRNFHISDARKLRICFVWQMVTFSPQQNEMQRSPLFKNEARNFRGMQWNLLWTFNRISGVMGRFSVKRSCLLRRNSVKTLLNRMMRQVRKGPFIKMIQRGDACKIILYREIFQIGSNECHKAANIRTLSEGMKNQKWVTTQKFMPLSLSCAQFRGCEFGRLNLFGSVRTFHSVTNARR